MGCEVEDAGLGQTGAPVFASTPVLAAQQVVSRMAPGFSIDIPAIPGVAAAQRLVMPGRTIPGTDAVASLFGRNLPPLANKVLAPAMSAAGKVAMDVAGPPLKDLLEKATGDVLTKALPAALGVAGSVVPGLGNLVGLALSGLVAAFKALAKLFSGPDQCEFDAKCPDLGKQIQSLTAIEALPVIAALYVETANRLAKKARDENCYLGPKQGKGGKTYKCLRYIEKAFVALSEYAKDTPDVLGLHQLNDLIPKYQQISYPIRSFEYSLKNPNTTYVIENIGERMGKVRDWTTKEAVAAEAAYQAGRGPRPVNKDAFSFTQMTARMIVRQQKLVALENALLALVNTKVTGTSQTLSGSSIEGQVANEIKLAAEQYTLNPNDKTGSWLRQVLGWAEMLEARVREIGLVRVQEQLTSGRGAKVAATPAHIQLLQFQCSEAGGRGPKCDELRKAQGLGPAPAAPRTQAPIATRPQAPQQQAALYQLAKSRNRYVSDRLKQLSLQGNQAAKMLMLGVSQEPNLTLANLPDKTYEYLERVARTGNQAAGMFLYAAVKEFQDKVKAA